MSEPRDRKQYCRLFLAQSQGKRQCGVNHSKPQRRDWPRFEKRLRLSSNSTFGLKRFQGYFFLKGAVFHFTKGIILKLKKD